MALTSLLFGRKIKPKISWTVDSNDEPGKGLTVVELDCSLSETHSFTNKVTEHPIEDGSDISDHIIIKPDKVSLVGFVTNSPVDVLGGTSGFTSSPAGRLLGFDGSRTNIAFGNLLELLRGYEGEDGKKVFTPVDIITGLKVYTNMVMTDLNIPRIPSDGNSLKFTINFQKLNTVVSRNVKNKKVKKDTGANGVGNKAKNVQKNGKVTSKNITDTKKRTSVLLKGTRYVRGFFGG